ncbi:MAG: COX15/CtaA family protein [Bacteroidetes bacterium]|nr:COX15/CtaA family protein [Bacteroidota bacterium]
MIQNSSFTSDKGVARWLYLGVFMLMVQILLGGITRLTESGLSITEWNPVTGILPPLNLHQWQVEFDKYKTTDQFRYINSDFSLSDFKNIFFWEWLHRAWARLMGLVFIVGFIYFLVKKKLRSNMVIPFIILFLLGAIQGAIGWIMVQSGLMPEKIFVGHIQLTVHFISALILLCYTLWFALSLSVKKTSLVNNSPLRNRTYIIIVVVFFQLIYGGFMAGLHAGSAAPTWPLINGQWIPAKMETLSPAIKNFTDNKIAIQFIHRGLAYVIFLMMIVWVVKIRKVRGSVLFQKLKWIPPVLLLLQILLGIFTVINSPFPNKLVFFGVAHQLNAMLFLVSLIIIIFMVRPGQHAIVK